MRLPVLGIGITRASFHALRKIEQLIDKLKRCVTSGISARNVSLTMKLLIFSRPDDLDMLIPLTALYTSASVSRTKLQTSGLRDS